MYYEEKVIDGVLHWRSPDGVWTIYTAQQLTDRLVRLTEDVAHAVDSQGVGSGHWVSEHSKEQP